MVVRRHGCPFETVYLQERHIAQAFQERMAERLQPSEQAAVLRKAYGTEPTAPLDNAVEVQNEIRSRLMKAGKPGYVPETFVDYGHARQLILALGGIPCYPLLADGVVPHCEFEATPEAVVKRLREYEVRCAEFIPNRNAPQVLREYVLALRKAGIVVTAGTEHNTRDRIPLTPACKGAKPLPEDVAAYFWEGACVVAGPSVATRARRKRLCRRDRLSFRPVPERRGAYPALRCRRERADRVLRPPCPLRQDRRIMKPFVSHMRGEAQ